ncbi:YecR-like lipofamily protein [Erwiniaceae bacterium BAC15a-03b]|uniref:YecR-like lipofamily protein n=1 Tax=Winslowiella arboricola TaxID=2978220 RepID=A0A9J6PX36_9GAMM|nr:YecR family lipoprotein [Winslowiella arboricola]MCU5775729.1 YecR-like lipofamily protein [Winslowiella arboricola]MCU5779420.1 YecR-like lipofamily protein [Winslowiella arboricola]
MKKAFSLFGVVMILASCATSTGKPVEVVNADRAGGVVTVGFVNSQNLPLMDDGSKARWSDAVGIATRVCSKWGYESAEELTPHARTEGQRNGFGQLLNGSITKQYQCYGGSVK